MATLSSHVLDSVTGTHAGGIRIECFKRLAGGETVLMFDVNASAEGRMTEIVDIEADAELELVFHSANYFQTMHLPDDGFQVMNTVVVRISIPQPDHIYHVPIMLSPHSYSVWWSGNPPAS